MCDAAVAAGLSGAGAAAAGDITAAASTSKEASVTGAGLLEGGSKALTCEQIDKTRFCLSPDSEHPIGMLSCNS